MTGPARRVSEDGDPHSASASYSSSIGGGPLLSRFSSFGKWPRPCQHQYESLPALSCTEVQNVFPATSSYTKRAASSEWRVSIWLLSAAMNVMFALSPAATFTG
jgi:hypothetical protein